MICIKIHSWSLSCTIIPFMFYSRSPSNITIWKDKNIVQWIIIWLVSLICIMSWESGLLDALLYSTMSLLLGELLLVEPGIMTEISDEVGKLYRLKSLLVSCFSTNFIFSLSSDVVKMSTACLKEATNGLHWCNTFCRSRRICLSNSVFHANLFDNSCSVS